MPRVQLTKLECIVNDEIDEDEVFLKYAGKKIWPSSGYYTSIDTSETFKMDVEILHEDPYKPLIIELWDFDYLSANDFLGTFEILLGKDRSGEFSTSMALKERNSTASYTLFWEIKDES